MVTFKRVRDCEWKGISADPLELAVATAMVTSGRPDPECFTKENGLFFCVVSLPQWDAAFPWDEVSFKKP